MRIGSDADTCTKPVTVEETLCSYRPRLLSPQEMDLGFVLAAWRDREDEAAMEEWRRRGFQMFTVIHSF